MTTEDEKAQERPATAGIDWEKVKEQVVPRLSEAGREHGCTVCGGVDWLLIGHIWQLPAFEVKRPVLPVVGMMCKGCGQILFFNAYAVGALKQP
jgi:hypothetical protein